MNMSDKTGIKAGIDNNHTMKIGMIGAMLVALILIIGTFWSGQSAKRATDDAVHSVSLLYLDELAGRR